MKFINISLWIFILIGIVIAYIKMEQLETIDFESEQAAQEYVESIENEYNYINIIKIENDWRVYYGDIVIANNTELYLIILAFAAFAIQATRLFFGILFALGKQDPEPLKRIFIIIGEY